jgi:hypothetical protein
VEPLHRRRVRRHERGHGPPVPACTGEKRFLDTAKLFDNTNFFYGNANHDHGAGEGRRYDPRQARQPAHPADHGCARDVPQYEGNAVLQHCLELLEIVNADYMYSIAE